MSGEEWTVLRNKIFDKTRWLQLPRDVLIGHDVISQIPAVCSDLSLGPSVLMLTGSHTMSIAGEKVKSVLHPGFSVQEYITPVLSLPVIREAEVYAEKADFLLGVGGGRVIDTAKIVAYNTDKPFISVPTAASHDGIASSRASVPSGAGSGSLEVQPPVAIIADTEIIAAAPHRLLASGCADIISNYTAILDWELSHRLRGEPISEYAIALSRMTAELLVKSAHTIRPHHEESAWFVIKGLVSSGVAMSIAGSSRPASGGEHKFAHALERIAPGVALHGEACGVGTIITMYLHGGDYRWIRSALKRIGAPTTPRELGVSDDTVVQALLGAGTIRPERFTILDAGVTAESAEKIVTILYEEDGDGREET